MGGGGPHVKQSPRKGRYPYFFGGPSSQDFVNERNVPPEKQKTPYLGSC